MMHAYYNPWGLLAEYLREGWFATGDLGWLDDTGRLWITGRHKEVINVAGHKVFPSEIEAVLTNHPGVAEVLVYPVGSGPAGEVPAVLVMPRRGAALSEAELRRFVRSRLAAYKVPCEWRFVDDLPRTTTGKVLRRPPTVS